MCVEIPVLVGSLEVPEHPGAHTPWVTLPQENPLL